MDEEDSFDKLLFALEKEGFKLPYKSRNREEVAWDMNRNALISALTDSGWVAG